MGNSAVFASGAKAVAGTSISALGTATDLFYVRRMLVDTIRNLTGYNTVGLGQVDGGSDATARAYVYAYDNGGPKGIKMVIPGQGGIDTGAIALTSWPADGTYITIYIGHSQSNTGGNGAADTNYSGVFTGAGTNTLADGQPKSTSVFWKVTGSYNAPFPENGSANGIVRDNYGPSSLGVQDPASTVDGCAWYIGARPAGSEDAQPKSTDGTFGGAWFYSQISGTSVPNVAGGGQALTTTGTLTTGTGSIWPPVGSTPTTVVATPSSLQINLPAGTTGTSTMETLDQNNSPMSSRTWGIQTVPNSAVATASLTGATLTLTAVAAGTTSCIIQDTAAGGGSAADATVNITVGTGYDWLSNNTALVTVGTGGPTETATDPSSNTAGGNTTITVTRHGTSATCSIAVVTASSGGGGSGSTNEPSGMTVGINTGDLTTPPPTAAQVAAGTTTWNVGTTVVSQFQQFSPGGAEPASGYETGWAGNLTLATDGPGYEQRYDTLLPGGYSPVRFGTPIVQPASPTGYLYFSALIRIGGPSAVWSNVGQAGSAIAGLKLCEPRTAQTTENHIIDVRADNGRLGGSTYDNYFNMGLQGPAGAASNNPNVNFSAWNSTQTYNVGDTVKVGSAGYVCILSNTNQTPPNATYWSVVSAPLYSYYTIEPNGLIPVDGGHHLCELLCTPQTTPATNNGKIDLWVGGVHVCNTITGVQFIGAGEAYGWPYLMFDATYGGAAANNGPPQVQSYGINRIYVSTK